MSNVKAKGGDGDEEEEEEGVGYGDGHGDGNGDGDGVWAVSDTANSKNLKAPLGLFVMRGWDSIRVGQKSNITARIQTAKTDTNESSR